MERITECLVRLWDKDVGIISWDERQRIARFQYTKDFLNSGLEISPLKMPLDEKIYVFPELREKEVSSTFLGLPGIFADSLPEKYGNSLMKNWLRRQGKRFEDLNPVEKLCYVGKRGMGALEYEPSIDFLKKREERINIDDLVKVAKDIILNEENKKNPVIENQNLVEQLIKISTSAGGAKAKALIAMKFKDGKPSAIYSGQADPREDLSYWIIKFSDVKNDEHKSDLNTGRLEYAYYLMAKASGIEMTHSHILKDSNGTGHFVTQRFDRIKGRKIHMTSLCGLAHLDRNPPGEVGYEELFDTARSLKLDNTRLEQLYRRMVFNILARNQDDHTKNHSFLMFEDGSWDITPAYDLCFSYNKDSKWIALQQMSCNGKRDDFTYNDLIKAAKQADISNPKRIIAEVRTVLDSWKEFAFKAGLPEKEADAVQALFRNDIRVPGIKSTGTGIEPEENVNVLTLRN